MACEIVSMVAPPGVCSIATIRACLLSGRPACRAEDRCRRTTGEGISGLSFAVLRAVVGVGLLTLDPLCECDAVWRFAFDFVIGISFGCAASIAATTEAPVRLKSRRGGIP